ncbi:Hypothetical predicted protein [Mytilus galloprovincialis]|uniref:Tyr recombinase domain-containing protein n=1 Tax=Mytilus galloprovincialis TaxID=29158 RepID=A0A8B6H9R1_MYTGA|nr:Hypothetical predicted protein [Mytilus galloprovincialis]
MTLEVTPARLTEILALVNAWLFKSKVFRKEVQSLIGKLNFIASCVKPGRIFISRILNFLREFVSDDQCLELSEEFKKDIFWRSEFLLIFNGISILSLEEWTEPDQFFSCDACLSGCGGFNMIGDLVRLKGEARCSINSAYAVDSASAFVVKKNGVLKPVTYNMFNAFLKKCITSIGLDAGKFSTHSFRRGGATLAFKCGVPSDLIQLQGDWKSSAYKLYLRYGLNEKLIVANKMMSYC